MSAFITDTITQLGYLGIVLLMLLEAVFPPIPSELIIPFAGFAAGEGRLSYFGVVAAATAGSMLGAIPWYLAGRLFGLARVKWLADRFGRWFAFNSAEIDYAARLFERWGRLIVGAGRLLPIVRTLISVPAGVAPMPLAPFLIFTALGSALWTSGLTLAGYILESQYEVVEHLLDPLSTGVLVLVILVYLYRVVTFKPDSK